VGVVEVVEVAPPERPGEREWIPKQELGPAFDSKLTRHKLEGLGFLFSEHKWSTLAEVDTESFQSSREML
jgi:hypothetical protein